MIVWKEVIRPGGYWYDDPDTKKPALFTATPEYVRYLHEQGREMLKAGLSIPVPLEHQADARPLTAEERAATQLRHNAGWVADYEMRDNRLMAKLDVQDPEVARKLPHTIRYTSPWLNSFTDGKGKKWEGVISHVALTTRPRIVDQEPFASVAASLSLASRTTDRNCLGAKGFSLDCGNLLGAVRQSPLYPKAFAFLSGIQLAAAVEEVPAIVEDDDGEDEETEPGVETPKVEGDKPAVDENGKPLEDDGVPDADSDVDLYGVLNDIVCALWGIELPPDTTRDNFGARLLHALMEQFKEESYTPEQPVPPTAVPRPDPVVAEQPPMYMSLEEIDKIEDAGQKRTARMLFSLQQNTLNAARVLRDRRIEALCKKTGQQAFRDKLVGVAKNAKLSMNEDGTVRDEMADMLDILETGVKDLPAMLKSPQALREEAHPVEYNGEMVTAARAKEVTNEVLKRAGLPLEE